MSQKKATEVDIGPVQLRNSSIHAALLLIIAAREFEYDRTSSFRGGARIMAAACATVKLFDDCVDYNIS